MPTVTVYTAARMKQIEDEAIASATVDVAGNLILTRNNGTTFNAGPIMTLTAPNGSKYKLVVSNAGVLSTQPV